ncbi:flagellar brake protein [Marinospirillum alkaliphilum]|nr:flagellar brake protein [Marinospirillum alkaliphilum]
MEESRTDNNSGAHQNKPEGQLIKSPEGVYRLLRRLQSKHTPLKLHFDSVADYYTSMVLAVNYKEGYFLLDEVTPKWGDELMAKAIPFSFDSFHDGCKISAAHMQASGRAVKEGSPIYKIPFPTELQFLQRRQFYRAPIRMSLEIPVRLGVKVPPVKRDEYDNIIPQNPTWAHEGLLRDLSAQGCQIEVPGDLQEALPKNTEYTSCHIIFPNGHLIDLGIAVRHVGYDENRDISSLGCQFINMNPKLDRQISFVVTELQRDNARASSGNAISAPASELFTPPAANKEKGKDGKKDETGKNQERNEPNPALPEKISIAEAHTKAVGAVRRLVMQLREKNPLSIKEIWEVCDLLLQALEQDRQELILYTRIRTIGNYLYEHSVSVAVLLVDQTQHNVTNPKSRDKDYLRNLMFAGLCHDLGKGLIPERIIGKGGDLTEQEAKVMHKHSLLTREILSRQQGTPEIALLVATQNCERLDGSGHPEHLKSISISPVGKLAAVIDVFDAMTNGRSYKAGLPHAVAYKRLMGMQQQLELAAVQQLIKRQGLFPIGSLVSFENGDLGFVKRQNEDHQPQVVRLVYNKQSNQAIPMRDVDLNKTPSLGKLIGPDDPARYQLSNDLLLDEL